MLEQLTLRDYAVIREAKVDFLPGLTVVTGDTGAGKSILVEALALCLGGRAMGPIVRYGAQKAELCAIFSMQNNLEARQWLSEQRLRGEYSSCTLRRTIIEGGRSRAFINGIPVSLAQMRDLGRILLQIQGQYSQQQLLREEHQRHILDRFANHQPLLDKMQRAYSRWQTSNQLLRTMQHGSKIGESTEEDLVRHQLMELDDFAPLLGEFHQISSAYQKLATREQRLLLGQQAELLLSSNDECNALLMVNQACQKIQQLLQLDESLRNCASMLDEAKIGLQEVASELSHYCEQLELDPHTMQQLEQRISKTVQLARKHKVAPEELAEKWRQLQEELELLGQQSQEADRLAQKVASEYEAAMAAATSLSASRRAAARQLAEQLTTVVQSLSMPHGMVVIDVASSSALPLTDVGRDKIRFSIATNPGQPTRPLAQIASGGELSRIALAIQVVISNQAENATLLFDEIDTGISGQSAATVGKLLRRLGSSLQVISVTHLPQVAACGHNHLLVQKQEQNWATEIAVLPLDQEGRRHELARMLGGHRVTEQSLANAAELLLALE